MKSRRRAVFLDRDGVLNQPVLRNGTPHPPDTVDELEIIPGAARALQRLTQAGYLLIGASNQPDVARKTQTRENVEAINRLILEELPLEEILVCYHDDPDECRCRKPKPGLILEAAERYNVDLASSFMIGDRWRDIEAGQNAGVKTILIDYGYQEKLHAKPPDSTVPDLDRAVDWVLNYSKD